MLRREWMLLCVAELAAQKSPKFFTEAEFLALEALTAEILPTTDTPGAREAGAAYFIDAMLQTEWGREHRQAYRDGLPSLQGLAGLPAGERLARVAAMEKTPFFDLVWRHTAMGCFANPEYGGNRGKAGWSLLGFEDHMHAAPPFGFYDGEVPK